MPPSTISINHVVHNLKLATGWFKIITSTVNYIQFQMENLIKKSRFQYEIFFSPNFHRCPWPTTIIAIRPNMNEKRFIPFYYINITKAVSLFLVCLRDQNNMRSLVNPSPQSNTQYTLFPAVLFSDSVKISTFHFNKRTEFIYVFPDFKYCQY